MSVFYAVKTLHSKGISDWVNETNERAKDTNFLKNPFVLKIKEIKKKDSLILGCDVLPLYPNFSYLGWFGVVGIALVWGWTPYMIPVILLGCAGFFWSSFFYYLMTRLALRKIAKYKGPIKRIKLQQLIKEVIF